MTLTDHTKAALRSFVLTFVVTLLPLALANDDWSLSAIGALGVAALRTAFSAVFPGGGFGIRATKGSVDLAA